MNSDTIMICHSCIEENYLSNEIKEAAQDGFCALCGQRAPSIELDNLCERVHEVFMALYIRTSSEPESWQAYRESDFDWERTGEPVDHIISEILETENEQLVASVQERLSKKYFDFEAATMGEEDPYGDEAHYKWEPWHTGEFSELWEHFRTDIVHRARFFNRSAEKALEAIFGNLHEYDSLEEPLLVDIGPGTPTTHLIRARVAFSFGEAWPMLVRPSASLGPPPPDSARPNRMNPEGVSMFYGAEDLDTCIAEVRPPVGSYVASAEFEITKTLKILDLEQMRALYLRGASVFQPDYKSLVERADFLGELVEILSRPIMPRDERLDYLPTQAVAEYLSEKFEPPIDGLRFPSAQTGGTGRNVVLFPKSSAVEPDEVTGEYDAYLPHDEDGPLGELSLYKSVEDLNPEPAAEPLLSPYRQDRVVDSSKPCLRAALGSVRLSRIARVRYEPSHYETKRDDELRPYPF